MRINASGAETSDRGKKFACDIALAKASELASEGFLDEAEIIVAKVLRESEESTQALDLLARIRYQQGRFSEAELFWKKACAFEPENELFRQALLLIAEEHRHPYSHFSYLRLSITAAALLLIVGFGSLVVFRHFRGASRTSPSASRSAAAPTADAQSDRGLSVELSGVVSTPDGRGTVITFDSGLFQRAATFKPGATTILRELAQQLKAEAANLSISVIGHTDDLPLRKNASYFDNQSLALSRALVVAEFLRTETALRAARFDIMGAKGESPLFPKGTANARSRSHTVELRISRLEGKRN